MAVLRLKNPNLVEKLLQFDADPTHEDHNGKTLLDYKIRETTIQAMLSSAQNSSEA